MAGVAATLLLVAGVSATFFARRATPVLTVKDTIVLAEFVNKTGDPSFNDALRPAFALELRQSPFLSLISEERIQHVLRLMAKPANSRLNPETAREICERTESAAVLDGSIAPSGKHYVVGFARTKLPHGRAAVCRASEGRAKRGSVARDRPTEWEIPSAGRRIAVNHCAASDLALGSDHAIVRSMDIFHRRQQIGNASGARCRYPFS